MDATNSADGPYRSLEAQRDAWQELTERGARRVRIGTSVQGEPLESIEIGPPDAERTVVLIAGIHPIEWIGVETGLEVLSLMADHPPTDFRCIGFPLVNVDGYALVERNRARGRRRFVRTNANGVDLNRNWPVSHRPAKGLAGRIGGWNSGGPHGLSEPELAAVVERLDEVAVKAPISRALSLHSIGRRILYPYGARWRAPDDSGAHRRAGEALRDQLDDRYKVTQVSRWVPGAFAHGMEVDTLWDRYGALSLLVECSWGGASLLRPSSLFDPFRWFNPPRPEQEIGQLAAAICEFLRGEV